MARAPPRGDQQLLPELLEAVGRVILVLLLSVLGIVIWQQVA